MKKKIGSLILIMALMLLPNIVLAASFNMSISCGSSTAGGTTTCTISGSSGSTNIGSVEANISVNNGATISGFKKVSGTSWQGDGDFSGSKGSFMFYTDTPSNKSFKIAQFTVKTPTAGKVTVSVTAINGGDNDTGNMIPCSNKTATITVKEKTTKATTTKNTNAITQRPPTTSTTRSTMAIADMVLTSVQVDDFNVSFENGVYYATVKPNTEKVTINATAAPGITVIGSGQRNLAFGQNAVDLVLRDQGGQTVTFQLIITRPEGVEISDTKLTSLKIPGYEFAFSPDTKEYTVTVPSSLSELYVMAQSYSDDVIITGDGLQALKKGKNEIFIRVSYGELASTEYKITIKRSYMSVIMWIIIGFLGTGLVAMGIYANINRKAAVSKAVAEKNKQIAQNNRAQIASTAPQVQLNGESVVGTGKKAVAPTPVKTVAVSTPAAGAQATNPVTPVAQAPSAPAPTVVQAKPTVVATPTQVPTNNPQMINTAPPAQVKVVKTTVVPVQQPIATPTVNPVETQPTVLPTNDNKPVI